MKRNNRGFSLVELIVVLAIMAVLVGILAPSLLRYVEKSRIQKDESAIGELINELYLAASDLDNYQALTDAANNGTPITYTYDSDTSCLDITESDSSVFTQEVAAVVGDFIKLESTTWRDANISVTINPTWDTIVVVGNMPEGSNVHVQAPSAETE